MDFSAMLYVFIIVVKKELACLAVRLKPQLWILLNLFKASFSHHISPLTWRASTCTTLSLNEHITCSPR